MPVERLEELIQLNSGERFYLLYGEGVNDSFITREYIELDIERALLNLLKERGFRRVLFYSHARQVYFLDQESFDLTFPAVAEKAGQQLAGEPNRGLFGKAPFPDLRLIRRNASRPEREVVSAMNPLHAIRILDPVIQQADGPNTALVFTQAETTLLHFPEQGILAGKVGEWFRLPASNQNICFFLFSSNNYESLSDFTNVTPILELAEYIKASRGGISHAHGVLHLAGPGYQEFERLVDFSRLAWSFDLDWKKRRNIVRWMHTAGGPAKIWLNRLETIHRLDRQTLLDNRWIASSSSELTAHEQLERMIGLANVKKFIDERTGYVQSLLDMQAKGKPVDQTLSLHMVFTGNPGTGKTTVARLMGEILRDIDLLPRGHLVRVTYKDLVAEHVGGTAPRTQSVIDRATGGVLLVDEAYQLADSEKGGFGQEAIETIMDSLEDQLSNLVVIVAGYPKPMREFLDANPGLERRFPAANRIHFPDYTPDQLIAILRIMLQDAGRSTTTGLDNMLVEVVNGMYAGRDEEVFGNAGVIVNLFQEISIQWSNRISENKLDWDEPMREEDLPLAYQEYLPGKVPQLAEILSELDELVGLTEVKAHVRRLVYRIQYARRYNSIEKSEVPSYHMQFSGNPGTGKTMVARLMGRVFQSLGILRHAEVVDVRAKDLVAGYVGQTSIKTADLVEDAMDHVLFIDEAYDLAAAPGREGSEFKLNAITELIAAMENHRQRLVVILAGYPRGMERLLDSNEGLSSRISYHFKFPDYTSQELLQILRTMVEKGGFHLTREAESAANIYLEAVRLQQGVKFGNGRVVRNLFFLMQDRLAERVMTSGSEISSAQARCFDAVDIPPPPREGETFELPEEGRL